MKLLTIDTSQPIGEVAYCDSMLSQSFAITDQNATALLSTICQEHRPSHVLLGIGPGRLSGLRSSASFVAGLAQAYAIPIYTVSSLLLMAAYAHHTTQHTTIQVIIDARMGQYFIAQYRFDKDVLHIEQEAHLSSAPVKNGFTVGMLAAHDAHMLDVCYTQLHCQHAFVFFDQWLHAGIIDTVDPYTIAIHYMRHAVDKTNL